MPPDQEKVLSSHQYRYFTCTPVYFNCFRLGSNTEILQNMIAGTKDTTLSEQAKYKEPKVLEVGFFGLLLLYGYIPPTFNW